MVPHAYGSGAPGEKILREHRRDSGVAVSVKMGWRKTGHAISVIVRIGEPEDYVVQIRTDPSDVVKCERLSLHWFRCSGFLFWFLRRVCLCRFMCVSEQAGWNPPRLREKVNLNRPAFWTGPSRYSDDSGLVRCRELFVLIRLRTANTDPWECSARLRSCDQTNPSIANSMILRCQSSASIMQTRARW